MAFHVFTQLLSFLWSAGHTVVLCTGVVFSVALIIMAIHATIDTHRTGESYTRWIQRLKVLGIKQSIMDEEELGSRLALKEWFLRKIEALEIGVVCERRGDVELLVGRDLERLGEALCEKLG